MKSLCIVRCVWRMPKACQRPDIKIGRFLADSHHSSGKTSVKRQCAVPDLSAQPLADFKLCGLRPMHVQRIHTFVVLAERYPVTQIKELARKYLEQHYFVGSDGLLHTPVGRTARSTIRIGRTVYPAASLIAEMRRQIGSA